MQTIFERYKKMRVYLLESINDLTIEQLNEIPKGFSNNIIWNVAHLIVTQQIICYKRANLNIIIEESLFELYKPGSIPEAYVSEEKFEEIKKQFLDCIGHLEKDYKNNLFSNYTAWNTRFGAELINIDVALQFLPYHEGLHQGTIAAIKKLVS
jgi:trehalose-6-phosphate synthase